MAGLKSTRDRTPLEWETYESAKCDVWFRSNGVCEFPECHQRPDTRGPHHVLPQNKGGPDTVDNLLALCPEHHAWVHNHPSTAIEMGLLAKPAPPGLCACSHPPADHRDWGQWDAIKCAYGCPPALCIAGPEIGDA